METELQAPGSKARSLPIAKKWLIRGAVGVVSAYVLFGGTVALAMLSPPDRFGQFMNTVPPALVWGILPGPRMWLWAREGALREGDTAPDFTLSTHDHSREVTLSQHRGARPVVLVFGSYT